jgi:hypothetical protein
MCRLGLLLISLVLAWPNVLGAQEIPKLTSGTRVRIRESSTGISATHSGVLVEVTGDTVAVQPEHRPDTLRVSLSSVTSIEVSQGLKSRTAAGIGYGALIGVAAGALTAVAACGIASSGEGSGCHALGEDPYADATGLTVAGGAVVGGIVGSIVGGIIGATHKGDKWEQVPQDHWDMSLAPRLDGGFSLAFAMSF